MPMYRGKPFEARFCTEENKADIEQWGGFLYAIPGMYYDKEGAEYHSETFHDLFEEVPGSML